MGEANASPITIHYIQVSGNDVRISNAVMVLMEMEKDNYGGWVHA
jgi:hypothetical protein